MSVVRVAEALEDEKIQKARDGHFFWRLKDGKVGTSKVAGSGIRSMVMRNPQGRLSPLVYDVNSRVAGSAGDMATAGYNSDINPQTIGQFTQFIKDESEGYAREQAVKDAEKRARLMRSGILLSETSAIVEAITAGNTEKVKAAAAARAATGDVPTLTGWVGKMTAASAKLREKGGAYIFAKISSTGKPSASVKKDYSDLPKNGTWSAWYKKHTDGKAVGGRKVWGFLDELPLVATSDVWNQASGALAEVMGISSDRLQANKDQATARDRHFFNIKAGTKAYSAPPPDTTRGNWVITYAEPKSAPAAARALPTGAPAIGGVGGSSVATTSGGFGGLGGLGTSS
jgi:hypothetical protein